MKTYDVAAYVWPSYHPDPRARIFWPMGIGEWETVMKNGPKFPGHQQPRQPLWGYVNEADPSVMEMQIEAATDHGVNVFIYDWYWYDRLPFLEGCLNDGFLKAKNNHKMKFYLMWANHDVSLMWDLRNSDDAFTGRNKARIWQGGVDRAEFERVCHRLIERYFSHPCYYKIDGKPVFMIYDPKTFIEGIGGLDAARAALDWFREQVVLAGHPGLELQSNIMFQPPATMNHLNVDSLTHYHFAHITNVDRDYNEIMNDVAKAWDGYSKQYQQRYHPQVSVGWDANPRLVERLPEGNACSGIVTNNTPENVEKALRLAKKFVDAHPDQAPLITVNSWNEWTETSYLQPCDMYGYGYLQAVRNVFKPVSGAT